MSGFLLQPSCCGLGVHAGHTEEAILADSDFEGNPSGMLTPMESHGFIPTLPATASPRAVQALADRGQMSGFGDLIDIQSSILNGDWASAATQIIFSPIGLGLGVLAVLWFFSGNPKRRALAEARADYEKKVAAIRGKRYRRIPRVRFET